MNNGDNSVVARVVCDEKAARRLADSLSEHFEASDIAVAAFEAPNRRWTVEAYFAEAPNEAAVRAHVAQTTGRDAAAALVFDTVEAKDWIAASLAGLKPVAAGRFTVHGAHDRARVAPNRIGIEIEAALAFGTGHHGTTRGCLLALDRIVKRRHPHRVLDIGTGTGVLAIAAAKALHAPVLASDIDADSVRIARENVRLNGAAPWVECLRAAGLTAARFRARAPFDLIFANILLRPLTRLAGPLARAAAPGAQVVLSGLLATQENAALAAYRPHGFTLAHRILLDEWVTLVVRKSMIPKSGTRFSE